MCTKIDLQLYFPGLRRKVLIQQKNQGDIQSTPLFQVFFKMQYFDVCK